MKSILKGNEGFLINISKLNISNQKYIVLPKRFNVVFREICDFLCEGVHYVCEVRPGAVLAVVAEVDALTHRRETVYTYTTWKTLTGSI